MRKRRSGRIAINPVPPYIPNTPKGAGLTDVQGRPLLSFYLIKPAKINLPLCARLLFPPAKDTRKQHVHEGIIYTVCLHNACARTVLFGLPSISVEARFGCPNKRGVLCIKSWRRRSSRRRCSSSASSACNRQACARWTVPHGSRQRDGRACPVYPGRLER